KDVFIFVGMTVSEIAYVDGGEGNDGIFGWSTGGNLRGGAGDNSVLGSPGDDTLTGGAGNDEIIAGDGNDTIVISGTDAQGDSLNAGGGLFTDSILVTGTSLTTLAGFNATASGIEHWEGNKQGISGTSADNTFDFSGLVSASWMSFIAGNAGNDKLTGS